ITDSLGKPAYMTWEQVDELYRAGHEIGSHTLFGDSIVNTKWFEDKFGRVFDHKELVTQIKDSKEKLEKRGYEVKTFAYPLGEWNRDVVQVVKESGYIAARDTTRDYLISDRRTPTISYDQNYIWHMHYHKPELQSLEELKKSIWYNAWWQFEDRYTISADNNKNIKRLSSLKLAEDSYEIVTLPDVGDKIKNKFIVNHDGNFTIEVFGSTGENLKDFYSYLENIKISIDGKALKTKAGDKSSCLETSNRYYCSYFVYSNLQKGVHSIGVESDNNGFVRVDKFRVFREISIQDSYEVTIAEFKSNSDKIIDSIDFGVTFSDDFNGNEVIEESGSINKSSSPYWWINSGAFLIKEGGVGKTLFGGIDKNSKWQKSYLQYNAVDTDNGFHPQNIFRLITRSRWQNFQQTIYAKIKKYNLSESKNRSESNGLLLFNRYIDSDNLYYTGIRVDGTAVIKKKINGNYYTLTQKSFYKTNAPYNRDTNPNIIPDQKWIGLRSEIKTNSDNTVDIKLFIDKDKTGNWVLAAEAIDDGKSYGGGAILNEDYAGIRADFMDVEFDDYKIIKQ
ncbi:MAG: polysaccharide deacetylase family protein, partial [Patescibacteria group bacterium]